MQQIIDKINDLRKEIDEHNYRYYVLNEPTISDKDFDLLMSNLESLESKYPELITSTSPTQRVGSDRTESFVQIKHSYPMLSLSNTYNYDEVMSWYSKLLEKLSLNDIDVVAELKYDGLSISLTYIDGILSNAVTRGDGIYGDDVTTNIKAIRSIPLKLRGNNIPQKVEIRGEVLLPFKEFYRLNKDREEKGLSLFANPRNAASGTLKQLNPNIVFERNLDAYFYYVLGDDRILPETHIERINLCKNWGLKVPTEIEICHNINDIYKFLNRWDKERTEQHVATDGVVLKINNINFQNTLGFTTKSPRWAIAYKFNTERSLTKLISVDFSVGRTGIVTPVANLSPIKLSGTIVKRASLHNYDIIKSLNLHNSDMVYVEKGGEIIPKIVGIELSLRSVNSDPIAFPLECPSCKSLLYREDGEVAYYCPNNSSCPPQIIASIEHYCSRKAANINIGSETIKALYKAGLVSCISDLYTLTVENITLLPRIAHKSAANIINSINASKNREFYSLLYALGIKHVGETVAKILVKNYNNIEDLKNAKIEELCSIKDIGHKIGQSIIKYFENHSNVELVYNLIKMGLSFSNKSNQTIKLSSNSSPIFGLSIVVSGIFEHYTRNDYHKIIEDHGAKVISSISNKTSFVLAGKNMGPSKKDKANRLGIKIMSEQEFLHLLGNNTKNNI